MNSSRHRIPGVQLILIGLVALSLPISGWFSIYPPNTLLQLGPVAIGLAFFLWALARFPLSTGSVACITAFLLLHDLAACWTYSDVPYDAWGRTLFGFSIDAVCGFKRDMFDRLVHICFGLLSIRPVSEIARRNFGLGPRAALYTALSFVAAISALYEIFEWSLTIFMDPASAAEYNGEQGDPFDSQKDMAVAIAGGALATLIAAVRGKHRADAA